MTPRRLTALRLVICLLALALNVAAAIFVNHNWPIRLFYVGFAAYWSFAAVDNWRKAFEARPPNYLDKT